MERICQKSYKSILLIAISSFTIMGCVRKVDAPSRVTLVIPNQLTSSASKVDLNYSQKNLDSMAVGDPQFNALLNPSVISGFNCFVVFVGGAGFDAGTCTTTDNMQFGFGKFVGGVPAGSTISLEVPSGQRNIAVVGLYTATAALCVDFHQNGPDSNFSEPHVLGGVSVDMKPGDLTVTVPVSLTSATKKITKCDMPHAGGNGPGGAFYGMGEDGSYTWSSPVTLNSATRGDGRKLYSIDRVNSITQNTSGTYNVTVDSDWLAGNQIGPNDELMLYIAATSGTNSCGTGFTGLSSSTHVRAVTSASSMATMEVDGLDPRIASIPTVNLAPLGVNATAGIDNRVFCRVVAMRVPHFNNVTLSSAASISTTGGFGSMGVTPNHLGGILPIRITGIFTVNPGTSYIDQSNKGYYAGGYYSASNYSAQGVFGRMLYSSSTACIADGNGGGELSGGGHGGIGAGTNGGGVAGDEYGCMSGYDASMKCLTGKFFMGGGGGGASTNVGGIGGGAIRLHAKSIVISTSSTLNINVDGQAAGTQGGGGAGGSIFVVFDTISGAGNIIVSAKGGNGASGGGGGGGRIHVKQNGVSTLTGAANAYANGGTGTASGAAGTCFAEGATITGCP